ncbi:MAG TPA: 1-deoxy-D-xylulose-5-phosphate reductoisomerase [Firmicutes bacterium]|nr:1-deoxy-D-xylulose-5-phosphate reductoisomerase [Bacillota bacterium]
MLHKTISLLGSTGSIGTQALAVVREHGFRIAALAAHSNIHLLENQAREYCPDLVCIYNKELYTQLKDALKDTSVRVTSGMEGLLEAATWPTADMVLNAVVGMVGLQPTLAAIQAGKSLALANKETLVTGGQLVIEAAQRHHVAILPVDSEHSAIFQCLQGNRPEQVKKLILTASGGPFFGKKREDLQKVTVADALNHPNWNMGAKITIDSATLMNKGLEMIEAAWLFHKTIDDIEVLVHRESVIHSAVEYVDHSVIAQLGVPDMKIPIQYALTYPERYPCPVQSLNLLDYGQLTFAAPDPETFVCLKACREAMHRGGLYPTLVNGANEQAVDLFLHQKISFLEIGDLVYGALHLSVPEGDFSITDVLDADRRARAYVLEQVC